MSTVFFYINESTFFSEDFEEKVNWKFEFRKENEREKERK